jgi:acyl-CoA synthetase (AMP-forming)/AMP-acid ligase II
MTDTLLEVLETRALNQAARRALVFDGEPLHYGELWQDIERFSRHLVSLGISPGDRVVLAVPNSHEFFPVFYGIQRAGAIAVPLFPDSAPSRTFDIAGLCGAEVVVVASDLDDQRRKEFETLAAEREQTFIRAAEGRESAAKATLPPVDREAVAFIQYTSGSTGDPKGVQISHANLLTNMQQMIAGMEITPEDVFVSWLPVYHDMGLILMTMVPFLLAARLVLLPTNLRSIRRWMATIADERATFTAAPDFAYRLCLRYIGDPSNYDLSSLRVALNAAEPVRAPTIENFEECFGLPPTMAPAYGLAEATVGVSMWPPQTPFRQDEKGIVSVGRPFPEIEIEIVRDGKPVGAGEAGEIVVRSPANTRGYLSNPRANRELFHAEGAIRTGDQGYLDDDGYLYVLGRIKNIIIQAGRNIAPQEVEEAVDSLDVIRRSAAVGIDRGGVEGEQIYVFAELTRQTGSGEAPSEIAVEVVRAIHARIGLRPGRVYLTRPKTIPMTYNGKVQHPLLKKLYLDGTLRQRGDLLYPDY